MNDRQPSPAGGHRDDSCPLNGARERLIADERLEPRDRRCSAVAFADHGFWPVTSRPSAMTYDTNGGHAI